MAYSETDLLHSWVEDETRQLDVVASWETLCDVYEILRFSDPINDSIKMEEFKWIIKEMNKHLTRARRQLLSCRTMEAARQALEEMFSTTNGNGISDRKSLAYHKLRQRWVSQMMMQLEATMETMETMEMDQEGSEDGRADYWNE